MKRIILYICIISTLCISQSFGAELGKMNIIKQKDIIQLFLFFDKPPQFADRKSDRRIDLIFESSQLAPTIDLPEANDDIVKFLARSVDGQLIISLFFRYKPQNYTLRQSSDESIVFEVLLGNEFSTSYKNLAERLKGLVVVERPLTDTSNPYLVTPYTKDWTAFFSEYEAPLDIEIPVAFSNPPFPIISLLPPGLHNNLSLLGDKLLSLADQQVWDSLAIQLLDKVQEARDVNEQKLLALTYGEALARGGDFTGAYKQLFLLNREYSDEILGVYAGYLLAHLRCVYEDPYIALQDYLNLDDSIDNKSPLAPYFHLSKIDAALATNDLKTLNKQLLNDDIAFPETIERKIQIRQADYWYALEKPIQAYAAYRLVADFQEIQDMPYSLGGLSGTLYDQRKFKAASISYRQLASLVTDKPQLGLVTYRKNMANLKFESPDSLIDDFSQIESSFPGTEASYRGSLKKNDLLYQTNREWIHSGLKNYTALANTVTHRSIREEALFKQALLNSKLLQYTESIVLLQQLLREFQTGNLKAEAQALLIGLLPKEIKRLVDSKEYIAALVLAKQNRVFFENNWIDRRFLADIAEAYHRIGVYDEAQKLYLYLIGVSPIDKREHFFLPMIRATFHHGNFPLVEDYSSQYFYNFPDGDDSDDILFIRLRALVADERLSDAIRLLPNPVPNDVKFYQLAAPLFFRVSDYQSSIDAIEGLTSYDQTITQKEQFIYAESLFQTGNFQSSELSFSKILSSSTFFDQSLYRLAEMERKKGNEKKALTLFGQIVETGNDSRWKQYAERELLFAKATEKKY